MSKGDYEPPAGILISIHMINFIKHDNLLIDLNPHANFITGRNGSGKSSILVALSVGLGSNARLSGRGHNMANLIKDGRHEATIIITIKNSPSGYQMDKYGDKIVITRKIQKTSTKFEISNFPRSNPTLVREELTRILQFYNIQVDNPCSIMHQDIAREFVGTSTPQKKYELFMRGTLITRLSEDIAKISANIQAVSLQKEEKDKEKIDLDRRFLEQQKKNDIVEEANSMMDRIHDLEDRLMWSYYRVAAKKSEEAASSLIEVQNKLEKAKNNLAEKQNEVNNARLEYENSKRIMKEEMERIAEVKKQKDRAAALLSKIRADLATQKNQLKQKENTVMRIQKEIESKKREKEKLVAKREKALEKMMEKKQKYIADLEDKEEMIHRQLEATEHKLAEITATHSQISSSVDDVRSTIRSCNDKLASISSKLRSLKNLYSNSSSGSLHRKIQNHLNKFSFSPTEPFSNYIKLKDAYWGLAVQHILGPVLNFIAVNTSEDERLLRRLVESQQNRLNIIVSDFSRKSIAQNNLPPPAPNSYQMSNLITIKDEPIRSNSNHTASSGTVISNILCETQNVDNIWCTDEVETAKELAFGRKKVLAITPDGVQFKFQNGYEVRVGKKYDTCRIGVDQTERIALLEEQESRAKNDKNQAEEALQSLESQIRNIKKEKISLERSRNELTNQLNKIRAQLQNPPDDTDDFDMQINSIEVRIEKLTNNMKEDQKAIPVIQNKIHELQAEKANSMSTFEEISTQLNETGKMKEENDRSYNELRLAEHNLEREKKVVDALTERCIKLNDFAKNAEQEAQSNLLKARQHSPEYELKSQGETKSPNELSSLLSQEQKKYKLRESILGLDLAEIRSKYHKLKQQVEKAKKFLDELQEFLDKADNALKIREEKLQSIQHSVTRRAKVSFLNYQRQRKYVGKLHFNHEEKEINISVKSKSDSVFTDVTNLSGGEKSYCLVSLLLSLWEVMECPFYCVDEFDVCMDDINRQAATSLLVRGAEVMENRQFIFITPLSLDHLRNNQYVTIFEVASNE